MRSAAVGGLVKRSQLVIASTVTLALAGCGKGGDDTPPSFTPSQADKGRPPGGYVPVVAPMIHHDVSPPLRTIVPPAGEHENEEENERNTVPMPNTGPLARQPADPVVQHTASGLAAPAMSAGFDGVGNGFTGPGGNRVK
jgi:hypothetical protein